MIVQQETIIRGAEEIVHNRSFYDGGVVFNISLPVRAEKRGGEEKKLKKTIDFLEKRYHLNKDFIQGLFYFISELSINIVEHANADRAFLKIFEIAGDKSLEILIEDNGIGIKNSLLQNKIFVRTDIDALKEVLKGISSKREKRRGFGLKTSRNVVRGAFQGSFLLFSGEGIFYTQGSKNIFVSSPIKLRGAAIDCLIPLSDKKINIYNFIE